MLPPMDPYVSPSSFSPHLDHVIFRRRPVSNRIQQGRRPFVSHFDQCTAQINPNRTMSSEKRLKCMFRSSGAAEDMYDAYLAEHNTRFKGYVVSIQSLHKH